MFGAKRQSAGTTAVLRVYRVAIVVHRNRVISEQLMYGENIFSFLIYVFLKIYYVESRLCGSLVYVGKHKTMLVGQNLIINYHISLFTRTIYKLAYMCINKFGSMVSPNRYLIFSS